VAITILSVPEISCDHCRASIEGAIGPLDGVDDVEVDVAAKTVRIDHDDDLAVRVLVGAIEEQGYEVPEQDALAEA
jgi:copper chaperone